MSRAQLGYVFVPFVVSLLCVVTNSGVLRRWKFDGYLVAAEFVPKRAVDSPAKAFLPGRRPKALSSRACSTAQAPARGHEHGHFVRVRINASKTTTISKTGAQALRTQCIYGSFRNHSPLRNQGPKHCVRNAKKELDRGPLTTPKPPLAVYCPSETTAPSETRGLTISEAASIISQALRTQCKEELDRGPLTTLKTLIAPPLAPPTPAENGGPSETAVRSDTGGAVAATAQRLRLRNHAVFTPFLPRCTYQILPLRVKAS